MSGKDLSQYLVEGNRGTTPHKNDAVVQEEMNAQFDRDIGRGLTAEASQAQFNQQNAHLADEFDLSHLGLEGVTVEGGVDAAMDDSSCPSGACKI
ncbi:hypothetical protein pEaSNUABM8_00263 [Erwinia phage pEa_SNUABM_8]|nr:hypothetical protein pEaSNUABM8_00263 [Erwinia phage pEa_SNUABM_8]QVW55015.1 hypothetical protein pEaSNUABM4_00262 [Erwinia phage pEa_SNUABM_4]